MSLVVILDRKPFIPAIKDSNLLDSLPDHAHVMVNGQERLQSANVSHFYYKNATKSVLNSYVGINCGPLPHIANGQVSIAPDTRLGSTATYICISGYKLDGEDKRTCETEGWSGEEPVCERKG